MPHSHKKPHDQPKNETNPEQVGSVSQTEQSRPPADYLPEADADGSPCANCAELETKNKELLDRILRLSAEWDNYRKRNEKERNEIGDFVRIKTIIDFLPVYEDLQRALEHSGGQETLGSIREGVGIIATKFQKVLADFGLDKIKTVGEPFNPNFHEALLSGDGPKDIILQELESGYRLGDKVVKVAKVIVGKG